MNYDITRYYLCLVIFLMYWMTRLVTRYSNEKPKANLQTSFHHHFLKVSAFIFGKSAGDLIESFRPNIAGVELVPLIGGDRKRRQLPQPFQDNTDAPMWERATVIEKARKRFD